jgi:hypothetical protein
LFDHIAPAGASQSGGERHGDEGDSMDPELEPLFGHRAAAGQLIGDNILTLKQLAQGGYLTPTAARPSRGPPAAAPANADSDREWGWRAGNGVLSGADAGLDRAVKWMAPKVATGADKAAMAIGHSARVAPGLITDGVQLMTSDDKARALAGVVGGRVGAGAGAALASEFPPAVPLAVFGGSVAGDWAGTELYDHGPQLVHALKSIPPDALVY